MCQIQEALYVSHGKRIVWANWLEVGTSLHWVSLPQRQRFLHDFMYASRVTWSLKGSYHNQPYEQLGW